jgi:hypothetical protein
MHDKAPAVPEDCQVNVGGDVAALKGIMKLGARGT